MANDQFVLSPCTVADVPGMIKVYLSAFASDPFSAFTFPRDKISDEEMNRWLTERFTKTLTQKREMHTFKILDTSTNTLCAFLRSSYPHVLMAEEKATREREQKARSEERKQGRDPMWPVGSNLEVCDGKFGGLDALRERFVDNAEMYVADLLATDPAYQRKGLASRLLTHILAIADQENRRCYIEATKAGHPVYFRLGFRDVDELKVDLRPYGGDFVGVNTLMIREPQAVCERGI
ncbi:hypothetical protein BKA65DRAFT_52964 [Rhexocercosporidium sp. MPI-PUGE-AT-0058]|nr:hypothetical protein BKA65DRAFT_52964 [Rhexocercosporidium sp. MPI-PUGE-AT-0058]